MSTYTKSVCGPTRFIAGPSRSLSIRGAGWCGRFVAATLVLAGCASAGSRVDPLSETPWGIDVIASSEGNSVIGSTLWCSSSGEPITVDAIGWEYSDGINIADFAVVNQDAREARMGSVVGTIEAQLPEHHGARTLTTPCEEDGEVGATVSYIVLELELVDENTTGAAQGMKLEGDLSSGVENVNVILCPADAVVCDAESAPAGYDPP